MADDIDELLKKFKSELGKTPEEWATPEAKATPSEEAPPAEGTAMACLDPDIKGLLLGFIEALPECSKV